MNGKYILDGHKAIPCEDLMKWGKWIETANRRVARTKVGSTKISTVFLGLDHRFDDKGEPLLFETMVFGGKLDQEMERYSTWEEAEKGHRRWVRKVKSEKSLYRVVGWIAEFFHFCFDKLRSRL